MKKGRPPSRGGDDREIGWRERIALPELGIKSMRAKIDTGARTSALNITELERFEREGQAWVRFALLAVAKKPTQRCEARLADTRDIKNTGGISESRPIIETTLVLGERAWMIEISLANRENMQFDLIIGRTALRAQRLTVNSDKSFLAGKPIGPTSD